MLRATYKGVGPYRGVVKDEAGAVVAECPHWHPNRDVGLSAMSCAYSLLYDLEPPEERNPWDPPTRSPKSA